MLTFLIGGYYGAGNIGDEAILDCMLKDMRALDKDIKFIITSWNPESTSKQFNVDSFHWKDITALFESVEKSDLVILGGGGLFQDYWGLDPQTYLQKNYRDITAYGSLPLLAKLYNTPSMIYAVGLGPLKSDIALKHTRIAFENCQMATLRDAQSLTLLQKSGYNATRESGFNPQVLADPVFTLSTSKSDEVTIDAYGHQKKFDKNHKLIGLALRYWDFSGPNIQWLKSIANGLKKFINEHEGYDLILIPFQSDSQSEYTNDDAVLDQFAGLLEKSENVYRPQGPLTPISVQSVINKCEILVGMRYHSLIMGINTLTPVIGLPYDPKVSILMEEADLEAYCCSGLNVNIDELNKKMNQVLVEKDLIISKMESFHKKSFKAAKKNASLAIKLATTKPKSPRTFIQDFTIEQAKIINEKAEQIDNNLDEILGYKNKVIGLIETIKTKEIDEVNYTEKIDELIRTIQSNESNSNQLLNDRTEELKNYQEQIVDLNIRNKSIAEEIQKQLIRIMDLETRLEAKKSEFNDISQTKENIENQLNTIYGSNAWKVVKSYYALANNIKSFLNPIEGTSNKILTAIESKLNSRKLKGIFVLTSTVDFNKSNNQRVINLAKFLSKKGWGIIFVAWRWSKEEFFPEFGKEVFKNIFQIPVDFLMDNPEQFAYLENDKKIIVLEFPYPGFLLLALRLKNFGYKIVYEIIDDWEEFSKVNQSVWFNKQSEQAIVLNADLLIGVSQPLADKFNPLRQDIHIIPNGFSPELLGRKHRNISKKDFDNQEIHIGYFGHLTDSWFDWDFLGKVINRSLDRGKNIKFHLIGYGEPDINKILDLYPERIILHGRVDPNKLYRYAKNWDLAMIPFISGALAEAVDPLKVYEYLYFGLPVIVKGIQHLKDFPCLKVVSNEDEFLNAIDLLKKDDLFTHSKVPRLWHQLYSKWIQKISNLENGEVRRKLAEYTWEKRFSSFLALLSEEKWIF